MLKRTASIVLVLMVLGVFAVRGAEGFNFASESQVDLVPLLAPPPPDDSPQTRSELAELVLIQKNRTPEEEAAAVADNELSVFRLASGVLGPRFTAANLPLAAAFFKRMEGDLVDIVRVGKESWNRPRPYVLDKEIKSCFEDTLGGAYPSGHSSFGFMTAVVLSRIVPEKKAEIFERAASYAKSRMICGVHYRSDIEAGRISGTVAAAFAMQDPQFRSEFEAVRGEVRKTLGFE